MTVTEATFCQVSEPPATVGAVGSVRSRRTVPPGKLLVGYQVEMLPAPSTARNWSSVSPSAVIAAGLPDVADPQVVPPSVEVRYW